MNTESVAIPEMQALATAKKVCCSPITQQTVKFMKLEKTAYSPTKGSEDAAGCDLFSHEKCIIPPNS